MGFIVRILLNSLAILVVANFVPGIQVNSLMALLSAGLVLGLVNAVVRPILLILTLPLTLVTLGLFLLVLNAICLMMTASLVRGFSVDGFGAALLGSMLITVVSWVLTVFVSDRGRIVSIDKKNQIDPNKVIDHKP